MPLSETYNEDCIAGMKRYPDKYFDLAVVDPPYGMGFSSKKQSNFGKGGINHEYKGWDEEIPKAEYWEQLFRVSKNQIVWGGNYMTEYLKPSRCWLSWYKMQEFSTNEFELAWTSFDETCKQFNLSRVQAYAGSNKIHPTEKPIKLYEWLLKNYAQCSECGGSSEVASNTIDCDVQTCKYCKGDPFKILDTHLGSQSSRIAAHKGGFDFVGFEIDPDYFRDGNKRFAQYLSQTRLEFPK
jgi:site-specific DNA-methyltransferase (adenine-specific)